MRVAVIFNQDISAVLQQFGRRNREFYSPKTIEKVASVLEKHGHRVKVIDGNMHIIDELQSFMPGVIAGDQIGMVFNLAYGIQGESRYTHVPAFLEMLGVPYVGSSPAGHALALDKVMTKVVLQHRGLPTTPFWVYQKVEAVTEDLPWPMIVKPKMEAVSMGLRVVDNQTDLRDAVDGIITEYRQEALVERFVPGREFAVGLLGNGETTEVLPVVEIDLGGDPYAIQTVENKRFQPREKLCPPELPECKMTELRELAREAFLALGLFDFARVDFRMDENGGLFILEVNSMASLGETGSYAKAAQVAGYTFDRLVNRMLEVAAERYFGTVTSPQAAKEDGQTPPLPATTSQPLNARMRNHARTNLPATIGVLRQISEINANAHHPEGVNQLGQFINRRLGPMGFFLQVHPQTEIGNALYFANHTDSLNDVLLLGHLDTVSNIQDTVAFREERGRLYGSGIRECKGGLAVLVSAMQTLRFTRSLRKVRIGILLLPDFTLGMKISKGLVESYGRQSRHILGLTSMEIQGGYALGCSGRVNLHAQLVNSKGDGGDPVDVLSALCQRVVAWQKIGAETDSLDVVVQSFKGQRNGGIIPDQAEASLMVRYRDGASGEHAEREIQRIGNKGISKRAQLHLRKGVNLPPRRVTPESEALGRWIEEQGKSIGLAPTALHLEEPVEMCFAPPTVPTADGFGPLGGEWQTPNEYIHRDSLVDRTALLAVLTRRIADRAT